MEAYDSAFQHAKSLRKNTWIISETQLALSFVFWIWALIHSAIRGFNAEVILLLFPFIAGILGMVSVKSKSITNRQSAGEWHVRVTAVGHSIVAIGYATASVHAPQKMGIRVFYALCVVLWATTGVAFTIFIQRYVSKGLGYDVVSGIIPPDSETEDEAQLAQIVNP